MSVFAMKLIAVISMLIDHLGVFLYPRFTGRDVYHVLRILGRTAFPLYAFLIVNGFQKTHSVSRYLTRLIAFAAISQIPFVLLFDANIRSAGGGLHAGLVYPGFLCAALIVTAGAVWLAAVRPGPGVIWPLLALVFAVCRAEWNGIHLLGDKLNVFYTHALGLATIAVLDKAQKPEREPVRLLLQVLGLACAFFLIRQHADYGAMGVVLILSLWLTRGSRGLQAAALLFWCVLEYLVPDSPQRVWKFAAAALSVLPVLLYDGRLGPRIKSGFYLVYPLHLAVLGALTVVFTLP